MRLLSLTLIATAAFAAPPEFELTAQDEVELAHRARIRCGGEAQTIRLEGLTGTFSCKKQPGIDVTDALRETELVVRGRVTRVDPVPAALLGDPAPRWKRATVKVQRVLKGSAKDTLTFLFISSTKNEHAEAPKVKPGQEGVWLLDHGTWTVRELMLLTYLDAHPPSAEAFLSELLVAENCPAEPRGNCEAPRAVCPGEGVTCICEMPCEGGAARDPAKFLQPAWMCRPNECSTASPGGRCSRDGMTCDECWGVSPWRCEKGRWKFRKIDPPP